MASTTASSSLDPLPNNIRNGMIAMGLFGLISTILTLTLMVFITYRMIYWKRYYDHSIARNQIFILIYNLLLADFQQGLSFLISFHWVAQGKLVGPNPHCFGQGWLIQIGDVSSGLWVLAIAVHTFVSLVVQKQIRQRTFIICIILVWLLCLFVTAIGPIMSRDDFFVPAGAWCWISSTHEQERLYLHYLWIFISQLGSLTIYAFIFFYLRGRLSRANAFSQLSVASNDPSSGSQFKNSAATTTTVISNPNNAFAVSRQRILKTAQYMVLYPFAYVALTLPLAAARVSGMAGKNPPLAFMPVAGSLMASCGAVDVLLYILTRKALVKSNVGLKGSGFSEDRENGNVFNRSQTKDSRKELESIAMRNGVRGGKGTSYIVSPTSRAPVSRGGGFGDIVVSKSVYLSEASIESEGETETRNSHISHRNREARSESDSIRSLVKRNSNKDDFETKQKSWLA